MASCRNTLKCSKLPLASTDFGVAMQLNPYSGLVVDECCSCFCAEFVLNPAGKSPICVLHEYAQHAMRIQPQYIFQELGLSLCVSFSITEVL